MPFLRRLVSVLVVAGFPLAAQAQGFSFCTDLNALIDLAPQNFKSAANDALAGAECAPLADAKLPSFRCIYKMRKGDEKSGTIWIAKHVQPCVPDWEYRPDYNDPKGPHASFDSKDARIRVTSLDGGEVAVTVIEKKL